MPNILVVDDELSIRESFTLILEGKYKVLLAASGEASLKIITTQKIDIVYLDIRMPGLNGLETLKRMKEIDPELEIIMVTAVNDMQKASEAIKLGARDYVVKPFEVEQIVKLTEQLLRKKSILNEETAAYTAQKRPSPQLIGQSEKIGAILKNIEKIKSDSRVLLIGEAGTEREEIAALIHEKSSRSGSPFISLSLSQKMSPYKTKRLLFGLEKGANTIELKAQSGLLEQAKEGALFIDNLENLSEEIYKAFSSLSFSRVGGSSKNPIQARLIGAALADLSNKKKDIFDFFAEALIEIPPLRERIADLPFLINHFIEKFSSQYRKEIKIEKKALEALSNYSWPGNIKELEGLIERFFLFSSAPEIKLEELPFEILLKGSENTGANFLSAFEKEYIQKIFLKSGKDKEKAAAALGINPTVLETKL